MATLTLLTTPIGNLGDISENVKKSLTHHACFVVEDTRKFKSLLSNLGIENNIKDLITFHDQSHKDHINKIIKILDNGEDIYVVSEAGSPVISDPAYPLIREAISRGHEIKSFSGVSSVVNALELSGLPPYPFHFYGFYPRDNEKKQILVEQLERTVGTHLIFESPHRVMATLEDLAMKFPNENFSVVREISKMYESVYRYKGEDFSQVREKITEKGEFVICLNISRKDVAETKSSYKKLQVLAQDYIDGKRPTKSLAKLLGKILDRDSREIYQEMMK